MLILIWGTTFAAIRVGLETVPPFAGIAIRFAIAAAVLIIGAALLRRWRVEGNQWGLWTLNAVCHFVIPYGVVYRSLQWLPSGLVAVLFSTNPLFVALLAHGWRSARHWFSSECGPHCGVTEATCRTAA